MTKLSYYTIGFHYIYVHLWVPKSAIVGDCRIILCHHTIQYALNYLSYDGCHCEDDLRDADGEDGPLVEVPLEVILV